MRGRCILVNGKTISKAFSVFARGSINSFALGITGRANCRIKSVGLITAENLLMASLQVSFLEINYESLSE
jgi:hypothetical protein